MILTGLLLLAMSQPAMASDETRKIHGKHMHGPLHGEKHNPCAMDGRIQGEMPDMKGTFMETRQVDGYDVTFQVMQAPVGANKGGSYRMMVKVEKDGQIVKDLVANSKVSHPNGISETKMMMKMGDWYMVAYDLGHQGEHELMVLFKTSDGVKHFAAVKVPGK